MDKQQRETMATKAGGGSYGAGSNLLFMGKQ